MALTIKPVNAATKAYAVSDRIFVNTDVGGDSSYTTGGSPLPPQVLGMTEIHFISGGAEPASGAVAAYDYAAGKLKTFVGGVETTAGTNQSALTWRVLAIGKGFATLGA
jgi:hypothetical protein